jgi:hypothetical protein
MVRAILWSFAWLACLGFLSLRVTYKDGLKIRLRSWPEIFRGDK